ncbi:hypothetical protein [Mycobacterium persicum]|uniref:Uncharacterized protein n=1 Tax=Mycobacterium persicum TaxID=1487726 RepID=A0AB38UUI3_9MYCO|nr:hypothetical protein [Mycobacterium persicum]ORB88257.1 hypothetical protein B1T49_01960 [Mycobacterium persicum]VAZ84249.1 hypothetical protein LAUMK42_03068 [Mycobacterium persicum]
MTEDPLSAFDVICSEIERQLQGDEVFLDGRTAFELLLAVCELDNAPHPATIAQGVLYEAVTTTRAELYGHLTQLWHARRAVLEARQEQWLAGQRGVRALLSDVLNVLLAAIAAAEVERTYALAEQRTMANAVIAEIYGDTTGVAAQRNAVHRAVADAIRVSAHGTRSAEHVDPVAPVEVIHTDVARRLRGEVPTDFRAAGELMIAVRYLLDLQPGEHLSYGPLRDGVRAAREPVYRRLVALWQGRRAVTNTGRDMRDLDALLIDLDSVVAQARTTIAIEQMYARAERRAMAAAVVAEIRGDGPGVGSQLEAVQRAAADALSALEALSTTV